MKRFQTLLLILVLGVGQVTQSDAARRLTSGDAVANDQLGSRVAISGDYAIVGVERDDGEGGEDSGSVHIFKRGTTTWSLEARLASSDIDADDEFGSAVAISGNYAIVGVPRNDDLGENTGSAYIFVRNQNGWSQQVKLLPADAEAGDAFGFSVAIDGDTAVIGSYKHNEPFSDAGAVYVFVRSGTTWTQQAKIYADDADSFEWLGYSVAVSGDTIITGALRSDANGEDSGAVYIFVRSGNHWTQQAKLIGHNTELRDRFGFTVAISGDFAIVGAPNNREKGAAYIFEREAGIWKQKRSAVFKQMIGRDTQKGDEFGYSVSISGETAIVGARNALIGEDSYGAAYVFQRQKPFWTPGPKLTASDGQISDQFGKTVGISGNSVIVGSPSHTAGGPSSGAAYIFKREETGWIQQVKLFDTKTAAEDQFGTAVDISQNLAIVGARQDDDAGRNSGAAYIFGRRKDDWVQEAKLVPSDGQTGDVFGYSVAISGETSIIGAYGDDDAAPEGGSAYIFVRSGADWIQQAKFTANDTASLDHFGATVAIDGNTAIVGAYGRNENGLDSGAAYVFVRSGTVWTQQAKLTANDGLEGDMFGFSAAISGDTTIIGAPGNDAIGIDTGAAYIFARSGTGWTLQTKIFAEDAALGDEFGYAVDINGDNIVTGAWKDDHAGIDAGSAYIFVRTQQGWVQQAKLLASDAETDDQFGVAVSISGETALIGAWLDDHPPNPDIPGDTVANHIDKGSIYSYLRNGLAWGEQKRTFALGTGKYDQFGQSLSIDGLYAIAGVHKADTAGSDAGAADIFDVIDLGLLPPDQPLSVDPSSKLTTLGWVKQTVLLQNYPNPFNPETWIAYRLAEPANVTLTIYNMSGAIVRTIDVGYQRATAYESKQKAIHWDGRNNNGERVSSGTYFYHLQAGDYQSTKKMVILK